MTSKKVFVSGCFDLLHSGHIAFLTEAASFGNLYVCIGSDSTVFDLKNRYPVITQDERQYMLNALKCVHECRISKGEGLLDFVDELDDIKPDIFIVNEDGHTPHKEALCQEKNIEYKVLQRIPYADLPVRSTTTLRTRSTIPFRIDLAGGWLDQPFVSKYFPGPVLTVSIEPTIEFNHRSGMSSSTRNKAIELWRTALPSGNYEQNAKVLFSFENPPGTTEVSGSQDSIGIVFPGLNRLYYAGGHYWPATIESIYDEDILKWLEDRLYLVALGPRQQGYSVLSNTHIDESGARALSVAAEACWKAILDKDIQAFGRSFRESFEAQIAMFPNMVDEETLQTIEKYRPVTLGHKLSGAGGGGYLIFVSEKPIENAIKIKIRRRDF
ncbi:MAG: adenylyltransferase/cytidyltransferase family protein [Bacteroidetes bacterium]|nr:adenylyltransferase/cytidyltransferase family protein [Bacteroidota bacterium]